MNKPIQLKRREQNQLGKLTKKLNSCVAENIYRRHLQIKVNWIQNIYTNKERTGLLGLCYITLLISAVFMYKDSS